MNSLNRNKVLKHLKKKATKKMKSETLPNTACQIEIQILIVLARECFRNRETTNRENVIRIYCGRH